MPLDTILAIIGWASFTGCVFLMLYVCFSEEIEKGWHEVEVFFQKFRRIRGG